MGFGVCVCVCVWKGCTKVMDKKKRNGVAAKPEGKERAPLGTETPIKAKPVHVAASASASASASDHNGDKIKASATPTSDKDRCSTPSKATHAPDDANKQGPQKKRRKVTHGTALTYSIATHLALPVSDIPALLWWTSATLSWAVTSSANPVSFAFLQLACIAVDL